MASYTTNYGLHQWEATDNFLRTDFNTDFGKIDAALGGVPTVVTGSYTGTGVSAVIHYNLGRRPRLLVLTTNNDYSGNTRENILVVMEGITLNFNTAGGQYASHGDQVTFDDDGFSVDHTQMGIITGFSRSGYQQTYWALC